MRPPLRPPSPTPRRLVLSAALLLAAALLALAGTWRQGQTRALPPVPTPSTSSATGESRGSLFPCVSYAPFRRPGDTPLDPDLHIAADLIEADLRQLATITGCVRTYGLDHGLDEVPRLARQLGLQVVLGVWIGGDAQANQRQLRLGLSMAKRYPDVIRLLMVGNEVLLRRELSPVALADLLALANNESPVPVSYADVWEFWLRHAAVLLPHVDQVSIHILPYWEDHPVGVDDAAGHVHTIASQMQQRFGATPVWVAETGWPAIGRQRGPAVPGRFAQAQFVREMLQRQARSPLDFNLIEGFDQPWKRALEGAMGGGWGLFDAEGRLRVPLRGDLPPAGEWQRPLWALAGGGLAGLAATAVAWAGRRTQSPGSTFARWWLLGAGLASGTALSAWAVWMQVQALAVWSRDAFEWLTGGAVLVLSALASLALLLRWAAVVAPGSTLSLRRGGLAAAWRAWRRAAAPDPLAPGAGPAAWLLAPLLAVGAAQSLALVFDARYRPLPVQDWIAPAVLLGALTVLGDRQARGAREERLLAGIAGAAALVVVALEGWGNAQAVTWAAALAGIAAATLWPDHRDGPASSSDPANAPGTEPASSGDAPTAPPAGRQVGNKASAASTAAGAA